MLYILEGLPGAGKTSFLRKISKKEGFGTVEQIIPHNICNSKLEEYYFHSDYLKHEKAFYLQRKSIVVMDRGYLSTLAYNYAFDKIFKSNNYKNIKKRFDLKSDIFLRPCVFVYIKISVDESLIRKRRKSKDNSIWCNKDFLFYMSKFYENESLRLSEDNELICIDGMMPRRQVFQNIEKIITGGLS